MNKYSFKVINTLNKDIEKFEHVFPITEDMHITQEGISRMVMLDRYALKDIQLKTLAVGNIVVVILKDDPKYPAIGIGSITNMYEDSAEILVEEEFRGSLPEEEAGQERIVRAYEKIAKPLELFYEQIAKRNAYGLAQVEKKKIREQVANEFLEELAEMNIIPAGRVMYGAGSGMDTTYFNCYVMPFIKDSREGIAEHRGKVIEIMSRGGGVGTNGSTLRPRYELAKTVGGKSSGSVSWLNDLANLTHLVSQGGTRRGAQMIMLNVWHPDIVEFIISKMQNPNILRKIIKEIKDAKIVEEAKRKLQFTPLKQNEINQLNFIVETIEHTKEICKYQGAPLDEEQKQLLKDAKSKLKDGGTYSVHNPDFLTGANISVALTDEFMDAVDQDLDFDLRFPDVANYDEAEMAIYNKEWAEVGDVREWEAKGHKIKTHYTMKARELWNLINICATYSAEPGIFFIDTANKMTNAKSYGQKVVATNPCGEQPLAPYSVCNLAAINLANFASFQTGKFNFEKLKKSVRRCVRLQDNVIDTTPYFLEENTIQAQGERRVGLGVMGLSDALIKCQKVYGSDEGNELTEQIFKTIAITAYETSIELSKEKGPFPFLDSQEKREMFINSGYMKRMPDYIKEDILKYGIRNSHLLTVAPTGTTGTMVGVATGLEPYFAFKYYRSGRLGQFIEVNADIVKEFLEYHPEYDAEHLPEYFVSAMELSPEAHAKTQCVIQKWIDSSISKTVNAPKGYTPTDVQKVYEMLWKGGAKGGTVYVDGSRDTQVLSLTDEENEIEEVEEIEDEPQEVVEEEVHYGVEVGDTCIVCRIGKVEDVGGCNTCMNCKAQLKCGL